MKKIVHIVHDPKFVSQIKKFQSPEIDNKLLFWGDKGELSSPYNQMAIYITPKRRNIAKAVAECRDADLVVVYSLIPAIVLAIPKEIKIVWRFFGVELYEKVLPKVLSEETLEIYRKQKHWSFSLSNLKGYLLDFFPMLSSFNRSIKRVNYFLSVFEEEYLFLKSLGFELPDFLQVPLNQLNGSYVHHEKKPVLLLGNSRIFFNNHIDIIKILQQSDKKQDMLVKLLFSYGAKSIYTEIIKKEALKLPKVELIEQFFTTPEFEKLYQQSAAVIINSYRQMALGNIFIALRTGTKIYLSEKNITFHWLKKRQFKIWSIEENFHNDLIQSDFFLSKTDAKHNFEKYIDLVDSYTVKDFQREIISVLSR